MDSELAKKDDKFWTGKLVMVKQDISNRGGQKILKGTLCAVLGKYRNNFSISTDVGESSIRISGVKPEELDIVD